MRFTDQIGNRRALDVEALERRVLMDGDVRLTFKGGDLSLRGDDGDNEVVVTQPAPKTVRVTGLEGTTVNGLPSVDFPYAVDDIRVNVRQNGADRVAVRGPIKLYGGITARLGDGEFVAEGSAGPVAVTEGVNVRGGDAGDVHLRNEVIVGRDVDVSTGGETTLASKRGFLPDFASATFSNPLDIDNPYFPLVPGTKYTYEEESVDDETGETVTETIIVEVTNDTRMVNGVLNRVLRDRVFVDGLLVEDTFDWHAQDDDGNVWYFGEESTDFEYDDAGNLIGTSTETSWEAGVDGARPGLIMLADPTVGLAYYQEFEPGVALDQGEVLATGESVTVPAGSFDDVIRTNDTSVLSPDSLEHKQYAPGLGLVAEFNFDIQSNEVDGTLRLISVELNGQPVTGVVDPAGFSGTNATGAGTGLLHVRGETRLRGNGPVTLNGARFGDEVEINGKAEVTIVDAVLNDLTVQAGNSLGITNSTADEEVLVRGDIDLYVTGSTFSDEFEVRLGAGDNELVVRDSTLHELEADGGAGDDAFVDAGGNRILDLDLTRFEEEEEDE